MGKELAMDIPREGEGLPTVLITSSNIDKTDRLFLVKEWRGLALPPKREMHLEEDPTLLP